MDLKKLLLTRNLKKGIKKHKDSYKVYIYKVLKQAQQDVSISSGGVGVVSANELCECIAFEASRLAHYNKRSTISRREVQKSIQMLLSGELTKHTICHKAACSFDTKAIDVNKL